MDNEIKKDESKKEESKKKNNTLWVKILIPILMIIVV